ncbi:MAG: sulfatase [Bryobacterales bacterium]|nr:sulfatase [Bryobacterales bacterium]
MHRRRFLSTAISTVATLSAMPTLGQVQRKPNVLFLSVDDMNDYGFHETYAGVKMPYLSAFKKSALTFRHAYCTAPACVPSRASVFSGLYPHTTGAYRNGCDPWQKGMFPSIETIPELFKRNGYTTFGLGKNMHAPLPPEREKAMWDNEYYSGGFGPFIPEEHRITDQWWNAIPWEGPDEDFPDVTNSQATIEFLNKKHEKPFFIALGVWRPHTPFTAPKRFFDLYKDTDFAFPPPGYRDNDLDDVPQEGKRLAAVWGERFEVSGENNPEMWRKILTGYFATTSFADWSIGRVIEALDRSAYAENTIVVLWSDNGYHCGEKDHWEKTTLWEKSCLVPAALRVPGSRHNGEQCDRLVSLLDLYPTLVDYCQLSPPKQKLEGLSLRPLLEDPASRWDRPALTTYEENMSSVRDEQFRYILYPDGTEELYDHRIDPHEFTNLAKDRANDGVKARLRQAVPRSFAKSMGGRWG